MHDASHRSVVRSEALLHQIEHLPPRQNVPEASNADLAAVLSLDSYISTPLPHQQSIVRNCRPQEGMLAMPNVLSTAEFKLLEFYKRMGYNTSAAERKLFAEKQSKPSKQHAAHGRTAFSDMLGVFSSDAVDDAHAMPPLSAQDSTAHSMIDPMHAVAPTPPYSKLDVKRLEQRFKELQDRMHAEDACTAKTGCRVRRLSHAIASGSKAAWDLVGLYLQRAVGASMTEAPPHPAVDLSNKHDGNATLSVRAACMHSACTSWDRGGQPVLVVDNNPSGAVAGPDSRGTQAQHAQHAAGSSSQEPSCPRKRSANHGRHHSALEVESVVGGDTARDNAVRSGPRGALLRGTEASAAPDAAVTSFGELAAERIDQDAAAPLGGPQAVLRARGTPPSAAHAAAQGGAEEGLRSELGFSASPSGAHAVAGVADPNADVAGGTAPPHMHTLYCLYAHGMHGLCAACCFTCRMVIELQPGGVRMAGLNGGVAAQPSDS